MDELPRLVDQVQFARTLMAGYPPGLREAGVGGTVHVHFRVLADGTVDAATVRVTRSTNEQFNATAMAAVRELRFRPARVRGRPVRVWVEQPIVLVVAQDEEEKSPPSARKPR